MKKILLVQPAGKRINDGILVPVANTPLKRKKPANVSLANEPTTAPPTTPPYIGQGDPTATATVQPPPADSETVQHIAELLIAGYAINKTAHALAGLVPGIDLDVWKAVLKRTGHDAAPEPVEFPTTAEIVARKAHHDEAHFRAAYIARAAARVQTDVLHGEKITTAVEDEFPNFTAHRDARQNRLDAAALVARASTLHGDLLGWYLNAALKNEPECIAASGNNFYASEGTIIGYPGAVHRNCGCVPGPPHIDAGLVDEAVTSSRNVRFERPKRYGLKRKAS